MRDLPLAVSFGRDDHLHLLGAEETSDFIRVVAFVGYQCFGLMVLDQVLGTLALGLFSTGEQEPKRPSQRITEQMDLSGQSATGSPQSLFTRPLFPVAAC